MRVRFGDQSRAILSMAEEAVGLGQCFSGTQTSSGMLVALGQGPGKGRDREVVRLIWGEVCGIKNVRFCSAF